MNSPQVRPEDIAALYRWVISDPRTLPEDVCDAIERLHAAWITKQRESALKLEAK